APHVLVAGERQRGEHHLAGERRRGQGRRHTEHQTGEGEGRARAEAEQSPRPGPDRLPWRRHFAPACSAPLAGAGGGGAGCIVSGFPSGGRPTLAIQPVLLPVLPTSPRGGFFRLTVPPPAAKRAQT